MSIEQPYRNVARTTAVILGFGTRARCLVASVVFGVVTAGLPVGSAWAESYRLGVEDKVRVKVIDWRAAKGEYQQWDALTDEYTVNPAGAVSIPLIGEIAAEGRTTEELAAAISEVIQKRSGLRSQLGASVEIIKFRSVYVVGEVERPGAYEFRPNLTVLQSVGLAGGLRRVTEAGLLRLERDRIVALGAHESARLELRRAIARRARLAAERDGLTSIPVPPELRSQPDGDELIAQETALMKARADLLQSQLSGLADVKVLYEQEVKSLADKQVSLEHQLDYAKRDLASVSSLVQKGLAVNGREFALQQTVGDIESKLLDVQVASVRAQEEARKADRDAADLKSKRHESINEDLQKTRGEIDQASARLGTANQLVDEATVIAPRLALERDETNLRKPVYSVIRRRDGTSVQLAVDQNADVEPGDVVRVDIIRTDPNRELQVRGEAAQAIPTR